MVEASAHIQMTKGLEQARLGFPPPNIKITLSLRTLISMCNNLHFNNLLVRSFTRMELYFLIDLQCIQCV